jgi:hypothetical protein
MKSLVAGQRELLAAVQQMQRDLADTKHRPEAAGVDEGSISNSAQVAQERLEHVITATHAQFARHDADANGVLDVSELTIALNTLGTLRGGRKLTEDDASRVLEGYDEDNNGGLDVHSSGARPRLVAALLLLQPCSEPLRPEWPLPE